LGTSLQMWSQLTGMNIHVLRYLRLRWRRYFWHPW
jgi:hypothetical protein